MAQTINHNKTPYSRQRVSLNGQSLTIDLKYTPRQQCWHMDIYDTGTGDEVLLGIKVEPNQNLTGRYQRAKISGGDIWCLRRKADGSPITYDNLGSGRSYELVFLKDEEMVNLNLVSTLTIN